MGSELAHGSDNEVDGTLKLAVCSVRGMAKGWKVEKERGLSVESEAI